MKNKIQLDMNSSTFQEDLMNLDKNELSAFIRTLSKIKKLNWKELYSNKGLRWELIRSKKRKSESDSYSFRFSKKYRATASRDGDYMVLEGIYPDHDGAYE